MVAFVGAVEDGFGLLYFFGGDDDDEADTHVEGAEHLVLGYVAEVLQVFEENPTAYMVMRFERGQSLERWLKDRKSTRLNSSHSS